MIAAALSWVTGGNLSRVVCTLLIGSVLGAAGAWRIQEWRWRANTLKAEVARTHAEVEVGIVNAKETQRRLDRQKENQDAQDRQLAAARAAADRNIAAADRLREQNAAVAQRWRDALGDSAAGGQCTAAGDAIGVLADVLGRADRRAGILAAYADAARMAGLKCERDYDALTVQRISR